MSLLEAIHGSYVQERRANVLARELALLLPEEGQILDVGCGDGQLSVRVQTARPACSIAGIDVLVRAGACIPVTKFDGRVIPFPDRSFDAVLFVDVLHHTEDPRLLLREAMRVTRRYIVLKDHTCDGFAAAATLRMMDRVGNRRYSVALPHNYWPKQRWLETFEEFNLSVKSWKSRLDLYPGFANWAFGRSLHFIGQLEPESFEPKAGS
jgi:SAM-dependent methyltransferase